MSVGELSESEQVVLLALVGLMARADGSVSESEMGTLQDLREGIGPERFAGVRDKAAALDGAAAILQAAVEVTRPDARELIFHVVVSLAAPDTIDDNEAALLRKLAETWGLESPLDE